MDNQDPFTVSNTQARPSVFDSVFNMSIDSEDRQHNWAQVPPRTMPWSTTPADQLPDVIRFTGDSGISPSPGSSLAFHKRKCPDSDSRQSKILITEDMMTEHFKNMSISTEFQETNGNVSGLPTLTMCPEMKNMGQMFEPVLPLPKKLWDKMEKPMTKALVVWKPPKYLSGRSTFSGQVLRKNRQQSPRKRHVNYGTSMEHS